MAVPPGCQRLGGFFLVLASLVGLGFCLFLFFPPPLIERVKWLSLFLSPSFRDSEACFSFFPAKPQLSWPPNLSSSLTSSFFTLLELPHPPCGDWTDTIPLPPLFNGGSYLLTGPASSSRNWAFPTGNWLYLHSLVHLRHCIDCALPFPCNSNALFVPFPIALYPAVSSLLLGIRNCSRSCPTDGILPGQSSLFSSRTSFSYQWKYLSPRVC